MCLTCHAQKTAVYSPLWAPEMQIVWLYPSALCRGACFCFSFSSWFVLLIIWPTFTFSRRTFFFCRTLHRYFKYSGHEWKRGTVPAENRCFPKVWMVHYKDRLMYQWTAKWPQTTYVGFVLSSRAFLLQPWLSHILSSLSHMVYAPGKPHKLKPWIYFQYPRVCNGLLG